MFGPQSRAPIEEAVTLIGAAILTEADLQRILGETESMTLEFKGPEDFSEWSQRKDKVGEDLSREVSAFANTYGGQILLGIKETREYPRKAEQVAGIDPSKPPIETLQRLVESRVRPRLEGVRYDAIPLSGANIGKVVYVITVPQGRTAYQAHDKRYYGRSEYESVPLEDQLIRYKMVRDRIAEAQIEVVDVAVNTAEAEYASRQAELARLRDDEGLFIIPAQRRAKLEAPPKSVDECTFRLAIRNTGPITILDCSLSVMIDAPFEVALKGLPSPGSPHKWLLRFSAANKQVGGERFGRRVWHTREERLFPEQMLPFPGADFVANVPSAVPVDATLLQWVLYMDDSPCREGSIALGEALARARSQPSSPRK